MQRWSNIFLVLFAATLSLAQAPAHAKSSATTTANKSANDPQLPTEETVNAFLQQMFGYDSSMSYKVTSIRPSEAEGVAEATVVLSNAQGQAANKLYITPDGKHALVGEIIPFGARPFDADYKKLQESAKGPSRGPADAPVTLVEFSDLQCPHCKEAQPKLDKFMASAKNARLVYQNFPLPMHDWAAKAAAYADCVGRSSNDAFWKFIQGTYNAQSDITAANADEKLSAIADAAGVKGAEIGACAAKSDTQASVEASVALGEALDVNSTPTIFINGRKVNGFTSLPDEVLQGLVDFAAKNNQK